MALCDCCNLWPVLPASFTCDAVLSSDCHFGQTGHNLAYLCADLLLRRKRSRSQDFTPPPAGDLKRQKSASVPRPGVHTAPHCMRICMLLYTLPVSCTLGRVQLTFLLVVSLQQSQQNASTSTDILSQTMLLQRLALKCHETTWKLGQARNARSSGQLMQSGMMPLYGCMTGKVASTMCGTPTTTR